jgi:lysophospholipase L1-like esterase
VIARAHVCRRLAIAAVLLTTALGGRQPDSGQAAAPGSYIALGDSVAAGVGSSLPRTRGYPAIVDSWIAQHTGAAAPHVNLAVPGETAASFVANGQLDRFRDTVDRTRSAGQSVGVVSVSLGGNELLSLRGSGGDDRQRALAAFRASYAVALGAVRDAIGADVVLVVTTYYDLTEGEASEPSTEAWWLEQFHGAIRDAARRHGARVAEVGSEFRGRIDDYSHHPFDVHPTNAGHRAIAASVWSALGMDTAAPVIELLSPSEATRLTPTLRFRLTEATEVASIGIEGEDVTALAPIEVADREYAVLLHLKGVTRGTITVTVVARDAAGNVGRATVDLVVTFASRDDT